MDDVSSPAQTPPGAGRLRASPAGIAADIVRHVLPLASLYVFHGNFAAYILMTAYDLALGLALIFNTTRGPSEAKAGMTVDPRSRWMVARVIAVALAAVFMAVEAIFIAIPLIVPAYAFGLSPGVDWVAMVSQRGFWLPLVAMSLLAAIRFQGGFEAATTVGPRGQPTYHGPVVGNPLEERKRSLAANAAQVTLLATFACLCYVLLTFGRWGLYTLPVAYAALLVFYDARPDLAQRIFPSLWQKK